MFNEENRKIKKLINSTLAILLLLLPLTYSSPAYAITQAEYDDLVAAAQAEVSAAQAELELQQAELNSLNSSKEDLETSLETSQQVLDQAKISLDLAIQSNDEQSLIVQAALSALDNAQTNLDNKQTEIETISNDIINQSSLVTEKTLELQTETENLANIAQDIIDSQEKINDANLLKQQANNAFDLATIAYDAAVVNYNASVSNVQTKGSIVDSKSSVYNQALANVQNKLQLLTEAQAAVDTAEYNYNHNLLTVYPPNSQQTIYGLKAKIYKNATPNVPQRSESAYTYCKTITVTQIAKDWGGGDIEGCGGDNILIHYTGYLTIPTTMNYQFLANVDDGWYMKLDNMVINDNWTLKGCGGWWSNQFQLQAGHSYVFDAWMYEHGGGACNYLYYSSEVDWNLVPASWFSQNQPVQPTFELDPALLTVLQNKQTLLATSQAEYMLANTISITTSTEYLLAIDDYNAAISEWQTKQTEMTNAEQIKLGANQQIITSDLLMSDAQQALQEAQVSYAAQQLLIAQKELTLTSEEFALQLLNNNLTQARLDVADNITIVKNLQIALGNKVKAKNIAQENVAVRTTSVTNAEQQVQSITLMAQSVSQKTIAQQAVVVGASAMLANAIKKLTNIPTPEIPIVDPKPEPKPTEEPTQEPAPTPEPIPTPEPTGDPNIPEIIEDLTKVNLEAVVATNLTEAQVEQLTEAAMQTFETAEQGSPEYEQALEALFVVAQANDIVISEELAAIPGAAALVDAINFIGNVGADMSPKVREESKKIVVTAVVAVGAAVNAATGAALTAAAPASGGASTGGSSGGTSRRRN
jgi:hypothetical protein